MFAVIINKIMENFEKKMAEAEADFESKLIAAKNVELIESYTKFKILLGESFNRINLLINKLS